MSVVTYLSRWELTGLFLLKNRSASVLLKNDQIKQLPNGQKFAKSGRSAFNPGLPDVSWYNIPKWEKYTKWPQNIPNGHKIYQMEAKLTKWP
jgi:hypothetical protein